MDEMRVTKVPAAFVMPKIKNVGVYCRVSTRSMEQLHSLASQVSHFTQLIRRRRDWKLYDFFIDIASGADLDNRPEFRRMMNDCENGVVNTVITKSISRFGRNTEQALISLRLLTAYYVDVIFEYEGVNTSGIVVLSDAEAIIAQKDAEILEQCRINGMGAEREATLLGKVERQSAALKLAREALFDMQDSYAAVHGWKDSFVIAATTAIAAIDSLQKGE